MTLFIDASAMVAMIAGEAEGPAFAACVRDDDDPLWSPMSCWETVSSLRSSYQMKIVEARNEVELFAGKRSLRLVAVENTVLRLALDAYQTYGKGTGHRAQLNMGDCFAYACAKANNANLLYKGDDFVHTDLA